MSGVDDNHFLLTKNKAELQERNPKTDVFEAQALPKF
jgi:hypothetical protein